MAVREPRRPPSVDCSSPPTGRRADKRRFVNLLQQLARRIIQRANKLLPAGSERARPGQSFRSMP